MPRRPRGMNYQHAVALPMLSSALLLFPAVTLAQQGAPKQNSEEASAATVRGDQSGGNFDIVVTAQKRVQNINDVGLTVTALSGEALKERQINSLADLAQTVPGLSFTQSGANTPVYTLRGVGFYETSLAAYPDVSVYIDEAPLPFPTLTTLTAFDLERVEVLKGPQGTLFGQNATGGALNYIAAKPTDQFEAGADLSYGRFNTIVSDGYVSGPLSDTLSARLSGRIEHGDDWQRSYTTDATTGQTRTYAGRMLLRWEPTETLRVNINANGWKNESDPQAIQYIAYSPQFPVPNPLVGYPFSPLDPRSADFSTVVGSATPTDVDKKLGLDHRLLQGVVRADYDVAPWATLTSLTSYTDYKHHQVFDGDGVTLNSFDVPYTNGYIKSFSQELRLASAGKTSFRWVLGANYGRDKVFEDTSLNYRQSSVNSAVGITTGGDYNTQLMENVAAFGNAEFDILPTVTLKGGLRYTDSKRHFTGCTYDIPGGGVAQLFGFIANSVRALGGLPPITPIAPGACAVLNNLVAPQGTTPVGAYEPGIFDDRLNEDNVSYRAGLDWKPNSDLLFYANLTKGYKAGSYPTVAASGFQQMLPVTQESVLSYEGGVKATLFDGMVQANAAAFYYDYTDKQLRSKLIDPVFGILDNLVNIPKSSVTGAEFEISAKPAKGLDVYANYTYIDAKVEKYVGTNAGGQTADFGGAPVPYAPKNQLQAGISYEWPVAQNTLAFAGADLSYRSKTVAIVGGGASAQPLASIPNLPDPYAIDSYTLVDLRAGVKSADDRWRFQVWGKNVFNKYYWTNVVAFYDTIGRYAGRPATYGVTLGYRFE